MQQRADKMPPQAKTRLTEALQRLVDLFTAWGKPEEAARWQQKLNEAQATEARPKEHDAKGTQATLKTPTSTHDA